MRAGDTVLLADFEASMTEAERQGMHYILAHHHRTARPTITLPKLGVAAPEFYTERELIALRSFYARQGGRPDDL